MRTRRELIDGNHILYHYLQKELLEQDVWLFQMLAARLFTALGVWFHPRTYAQCPILLPFVVRDPSCRKRKDTDIEEWGTPNGSGYLRDDNTLIKNLPKSLRIAAPLSALYDGKKLGPGFTAAHVWRKVQDMAEGAASRNPYTNSFIPNLVWLPHQVAKLTDREGSFAQTYLQALAVKIYRQEEVVADWQVSARRAWEKLPVPTGVPEKGLPDISEISFFGHDESFVQRRYATIRAVTDAIQAALEGSPINSNLLPSRYVKGLPVIAADRLGELLHSLLPLIMRDNA